eukprot:gb/GECH01006865.1/.p1 GENE.gb/GECH01006865.1/~~gb/GECH01006865.1/.p1  ORF type:complete len:411 (+),score=127.36 gb/GECH01006865.1/:1-1233(+)
MKKTFIPLMPKSFDNDDQDNDSDTTMENVEVDRNEMNNTPTLSSSNYENYLYEETEEDSSISFPNKNPFNVIKTRRRTKGVRVACDECRRLHKACSEERPCRRCIKNGIPHLCKDSVRKKRGRPRVWSKKTKTKEDDMGLTPEQNVNMTWQQISDLTQQHEQQNKSAMSRLLAIRRKVSNSSSSHQNNISNSNTFSPDVINNMNSQFQNLSYNQSMKNDNCSNTWYRQNNTQLLNNNNINNSNYSTNQFSQQMNQSQYQPEFSTQYQNSMQYQKYQQQYQQQPEQYYQQQQQIQPTTQQSTPPQPIQQSQSTYQIPSFSSSFGISNLNKSPKYKLNSSQSISHNSNIPSKISSYESKANTMSFSAPNSSSIQNLEQEHQSSQQKSESSSLTTMDENQSSQNKVKISSLLN